MFLRVGFSLGMAASAAALAAMFGIFAAMMMLVSSGLFVALLYFLFPVSAGTNRGYM